MRPEVRDLLQEFQKRISESVRPYICKLVLFGSAAREEDQPEFDVDVLVLPDEKTYNEEAVMETVKTKSIIGTDRRLRIDMAVSLLPGPVEMVVVVSPENGNTTTIDPEVARQRFLAAAGCGESGDPLSSRRIDEILYRDKP